jgi:Zn-dependent protease with chaperone function
MERRKGQVSLEFLVYTSVFMLAFVIVIFLFSEMSRYEVSRNDYIMASIVGSKVMSFATVAYSMGPDFRTSFDLPGSINGFDYNVTIDEQYRLVDVTVADSFLTHFSSSTIDYGLVEGKKVTLHAGQTVYLSMRGDGLCFAKKEGGACE